MSENTFVNNYALSQCYWPQLPTYYRNHESDLVSPPFMPDVLNASYLSFSGARSISLEDALMWGTSEIMDTLAELAYTNARKNSSSTGYCLRSVRQALTGAGLISAPSIGAYAKDSVDYFRSNQAFVEISGVSGADIPLLPRGTVVVYTHPTNPARSHAQIMLGYDLAASDYLHDGRAYSGNRVGDVWAFIPIEEMPL
ncbi:MAG: hypothetical protein GYA55_11435 [SAR324 cluster bacterium]|uniref:Peptidase C51 domain-containing protein n=1 Tax=SAR324 cluster bacterium TaxID=2024889 RepID=A0A7X9IM86_9DELT|nr:hypothetical protein [SAR324 cluster bacterium]